MSVVPLIPLRRADDLVGKIEALISDARQQGYGTIAYFLEMTLVEARIQVEREQADRDIRRANERDLWLPER